MTRSHNAAVDVLLDHEEVPYEVISELTGLTSSQVVWRARAIGVQRHRGRKARSNREKYSIPNLIAWLRLAAGTSRSLTYTEYTAWQRHHEAPSPQTMVLRFGSWRNACVAAGLESNVRGARPKFTVEECRAAAQTFVDYASKRRIPVTVSGYETWAATRNVPSLRLLYRKLGAGVLRTG